MKNQILFMLVLYTLTVLSQDTSEWLSIDCGSSTSYYDINGILWVTDSEYIQTGTNKRVQISEYISLDQLNSLRAFTQQNKNCYTLPTTPSTRYFIRSAFKYGNYDVLGNPPTFDLEIDGNRLTTVKTSISDISYYEVIYASKSDNISVCLDRTQDKGYPFISTLELWPLPDTMYTGMNPDLAWLMSYRYNYGANDWIIGYPVDIYNRVWEPYSPPGLINVTADITFLDYTTSEYPPDSAILDAVEAPGPTESISLSFQTDGLTYVEISYTEMELLVSDTRLFEIYIGSKFVYEDSPEYGNCTGVKDIVQTQGSLTVELSPTNESTLPPIISTIEVYTASDPLVTIGTSEEDVNGLQVLIKAFEVLKGWSGEPCLPVTAVWEWLKCTNNNPPRVTSINLSGYGLNGTLPDFSQMKALETIDLSNNSLDGLIPDFLGNMPNLKLLDLRRNDFSGEIPFSIRHNNKLKYMIDGNSHHGENKLGLIIGLAVGLPVCIMFFIFAILYFLKKRQAPISQGQATKPEDTDGQGENTSVEGKLQELSLSEITSTDTLITVSHLHVNNKPTVQVVEEEEEEEERFSTSGMNNPGVSEHETYMVPEMDMEELDELLQRHNTVGVSGNLPSTT